jgi:hypothetical protein
MITTATAVAQPSRSPRTWADVGMVALIPILTAVLRLGGMDIWPALIAATSTIVLAVLAFTVPQAFTRVSDVLTALNNLQNRLEHLEQPPSGNEPPGPVSRIGPAS